jgi:hypothetical protein
VPGSEQVCADAPDITDGAQVAVTDSANHFIRTRAMGRTGRTAVAVAALAILAALTGCGGSGNPGAAPASRVSSTAVAVDPTTACLELHNWHLHNQGQGVSPSFARQLEAQTQGTQLGTDIIQWLQDLAAPVPSAGASTVESSISQVFSDAAAVGTDCAVLGVRNTLPTGGSS